jgi:hypothetical protein
MADPGCVFWKKKTQVFCICAKCQVCIINMCITLIFTGIYMYMGVHQYNYTYIYIYYVYIYILPVLLLLYMYMICGSYIWVLSFHLFFSLISGFVYGKKTTNL